MASGESQILKRVYRFLARMDVAAILILVVLLLAAIGSCLPQLSPSVAADPERLARWETTVRAKYGRLAGLLAASGAFRCFQSSVFLLSLALLALATLVCTLKRWRGLWRRAFRQPVRCSATALDRAPHTAMLPSPLRGGAGGGVALVRERLEQRGFRVRSETAEGVIYLRGDRNRLASLATLVTHLAVLLLLLGVVLSSVCGWREEITIGPGETAKVGHGSELALRNEGFAIARYPDGSASDYEAQIAVVIGDRDVACGSTRVNEPLAYGGVWLYLHAYADTPAGHRVTLLVVRDPGYGPVIAAGFLLLLGLTVSFNFPHCWVRAQIEPEGTLRLAGRAARRAWGFGREFAALVEEIGGAVDH